MNMNLFGVSWCFAKRAASPKCWVAWEVWSQPGPDDCMLMHWLHECPLTYLCGIFITTVLVITGTRRRNALYESSQKMDAAATANADFFIFGNIEEGSAENFGRRLLSGEAEGEAEGMCLPFKAKTLRFIPLLPRSASQRLFLSGCCTAPRLPRPYFCMQVVCSCCRYLLTPELGTKYWKGCITAKNFLQSLEYGWSTIVLFNSAPRRLLIIGFLFWKTRQNWQIL